MIKIVKGDTKINKEIKLGGDYLFFDYLYLGKYRYNPKDKMYFYLAPRSWKKILLYIIIANKIFEMLKEKDEIVIADLGCGNCFLLRVLENNFIEYPEKKIKYIGIDLREDTLLEIIKKEKIEKIEATLIVHNLLNGVPLENESVDIAVCLEVIKYWEREDILKFLDDIRRVLRGEGLFFLSTQGIFPDKNINLGKYLEKYKEKGFKSAFYLDDFIDILKNKGFKILEILTTEGEIQNIECPMKNELLRILPREIIEAFLGFLYDKKSHSKLFILKKV